MRRIYFIIPVYNVEKYLVRCVMSVVRQSYGNNRIVIVNDGSDDNSPAICDELEKTYENITVIHKPNGGLSDARNAGIDYCINDGDDGDYISFLDSDDYVSEDFSEKMIALCEENNCKTAQCEYERGVMDNFTEQRKPAKTNICDAADALLGYRLKSLSCAKLFRLDLFKENIRFPENMINEDEFVTYRLVYRGQRIAFTSEKLYYYYKNENSIMDDVAKKMKDNPHRYDYLKAYEERASFFEKENKPDLVMRTYEKVCTDIVLRYCEQMYLEKEDRDTDCVSGKYIAIYKENYKKMIGRKGIPLQKKFMYKMFYIFPKSAVLAGRIFALRR